MDGADDLAAVDALQVDAGDAEVGVPELALDHDQRDSHVRHFDSVGMPELMGSEATPNAGLGGRAVKLLPGG
jgi:hypothetical protein